MMRIVFVGAVDFSAHCLEEVLRRKSNVVGVFAPSTDVSARASDRADLGPIAQRWGVPCHRFRRIGDAETVSLVRSLQPDVIFVFGLSQILPKELLQLAPLGCLGTHPALLPRNRGRHPLVWALVEGLTESGLTFFLLDDGVDSGDIVWQRAFQITEDDDAGSLYARVKDLASVAIGELLPLFEGGNVPRRPQDHALATYWRKRTERDGEIDWSRPVGSVHNLIRALARPYVGAHTFVGGDRVLAWQGRIHRGATPTRAAPPGEILDRTDGGLLVRCGDAGTLELLEWEAPPGAILNPGCHFESSTS